MSYPHKDEVAFVRLHALVRKGYQADLGAKDDTGLIRLEHPRGASAGAPSLLLCSDGRIIGTDNVQPLNDGEGDPDCIYVESEADWRLFQSFVNGLPEPTMLQALNAMSVWELKMQIILLVVLCAFTGGAVFLGNWLWRRFVAGE